MARILLFVRAGTSRRGTSRPLPRGRRDRRSFASRDNQNIEESSADNGERSPCRRIFIHLIRHDRYRAAPACGASAAAHERRGVLDVTVSDALAVGDILEPLFIEFLRIQKHHRRFTAELTVAGVAESLYMRAVRGHARMHVAQLRSDICVVEPVEHLAA